MKFGMLLLSLTLFSSVTIASVSDAIPSAEKTTDDIKISDESLLVSTHSADKIKAEEEIPVNLTDRKKTESAEASSGRLFFTFGIMIVILGCGYFVAKKYGKPKNTPQTKIKILTQHYLGPKRSLAIVRVAGESILIGITDQNINMIKSLSLLDDEIPDGVSNDSFHQTFNEKKEMTTGPTARSETTGNTAYANVARDTNKDSSDEFSIRHIKDVVSLKLKGMRGEV